VLRRLEFHDTPKHASWLDMVESEIGALRGQCLDRRVGERKRLVAGIATWERQRNAARAEIKWMFTTEGVRSKLARAYPETGKGSQSLRRATSRCRGSAFPIARPSNTWQSRR
jgi:hypothetical protein